MGDISTWSPVDESNTSAPPNGWPENQPTNTVNNCARAMMGAVRRWYDTVTAQLASLTSSLANYLPLAGGTLTGPLSAPVYQLSGVAFAHRDPVYNFHGVFDADGYDAAILLGGAAAGYQNLYRAEIHRFESNNGAVTFATFTAGSLILGSGSDLAVSGTSYLQGVSATNISATGNLNVTGNIDAGGHVFAGGAADFGGNVDANSYTQNGVPMVMLTQSQFDRIEARIAALEQQRVMA